MKIVIPKAHLSVRAQFDFHIDLIVVYKEGDLAGRSLLKVVARNRHNVRAWSHIGAGDQLPRDTFLAHRWAAVQAKHTFGDLVLLLILVRRTQPNFRTSGASIFIAS